MKATIVDRIQLVGSLRKVGDALHAEADKLEPAMQSRRPAAPKVINKVPRENAAALLIRREDRRGGWSHVLNAGRHLSMHDEAELAAGRIFIHGIDQATADTGSLDAAIAFVFGPSAVPAPLPMVEPRPIPLPNRRADL